METVEMDLMQAQIGSLASDVSRLEAKLKSAGNIVVKITDIAPVSPTAFYIKASMMASEINEYLEQGYRVVAVLDGRLIGSNTVNVINIDTAIYNENDIESVGNLLLYTFDIQDNVDTISISGAYHISIVDYIFEDEQHNGSITYHVYA